VALSGIKHRAGAEHFRFGYIYNWRIPPAEEILKRRALHTVESQFAAFHWLGLPGDEPARTSLYVDDGARITASQKLKDLGFDFDARYAVLAPTNEFYTKRWMPERYAAVADALVDAGYQVLMTGAPTDDQRQQLRSVEVVAKARTFSVNTLRISELVAVIDRAGLFVGNDSGPAHIAAAVRTPAVVLFGPASSVRWRPWRAQAELVQNYFPCNPCPMYTCEAFEEPECIRSITVDQVMNAIERVMSQPH
jgi:ADP-heptose:LPS heptosyltransferase